MFDHLMVTLECPDCGQVSPKTIGWLKAHEGFTCAGCRNLVWLDKTRFAELISEQERLSADRMANARGTASIASPWSASYVQHVMSSSRKLPEPLRLKDGTHIVSVRDAANFILKLPTRDQQTRPWSSTAGLLLKAAESGAWTDLARANVQLWRSLVAAGFLEMRNAREKARFSWRLEVGAERPA